MDSKNRECTENVIMIVCSSNRFTFLPFLLINPLPQHCYLFYRLIPMFVLFSIMRVKVHSHPSCYFIVSYGRSILWRVLLTLYIVVLAILWGCSILYYSECCIVKRVSQKSNSLNNQIKQYIFSSYIL